MNLKTLIIQPKEYFKDFKADEYENKKPIKLRYLFLALIAISALSLLVMNLMIPDYLEKIGSAGAAVDAETLEFVKTVSKVSMWVGGTVGILIWAWICVNVLYFVTKIFMGFVEKDEIKDKKYFKSLLYFRFTIFYIVSGTLTIISTIILRDMNLVQIASSINSILIKLWAAYFLYGILKYYLQTKKLHKILPTILYIITLIFAIKDIVEAML
ncbi:hypothetical protein GCM10008904_08260 [Paraclostridium ghonii]|uniref:Yip1 domain-containing protein n=1 Tax=Paraclostridium ghonii TaxID=29358 RepID=A0ABU0N1R3_9FIRM|nr:YIP1 family protein [Paeniclostridium ghonii]MDQ0557113.1 hypothetical protein [Paeniclostridium ghonii]